MPDTCPTCGSDERAFTVPADYKQHRVCPDPWHGLSEGGGFRGLRKPEAAPLAESDCTCTECVCSGTDSHISNCGGTCGTLDDPNCPEHGDKEPRALTPEEVEEVNDYIAEKYGVDRKSDKGPERQATVSTESAVEKELRARAEAAEAKLEAVREKVRHFRRIGVLTQTGANALLSLLAQEESE